MVAAFMLMSIGAFAQAGKMGVGVHVGYAGFGNSYNPFGVGAKFQYEFVENVRGELAGDFWFPKDKFGVWDANLNFQYLIPVAEDIKIYPVAGVTLLGGHGDEGKDMDTRVGFNVGAGAEYYLSENMKLNLDVKYLYTKKDGYKMDAPVFALGFAYLF